MKYSQKYKLCQCCEELSNTIERRRTNSQYSNERDNFMKSCYRCYKEREQMLAEDWRDYWSGCL